MKFDETSVEGCYLVSLERREDSRGFFARQYCTEEFSKNGSPLNILQTNVAESLEIGTLRGMHFQTNPFSDTKFVTCTRGAVYDVCVDLRKESPTFKRWFGAELSEENGNGLYLPPGTAHGYITLTAGARIQYLTDQAYAPNNATGVRFDDAEFGIQWPTKVNCVSDADIAWPLFDSNDDERIF